jgi:hypothetical protein
MKTQSIRNLTKLGSVLSTASLLLLGGQFLVLADDSGNGVAPTNSHPFGLTYNQWAGRWWKWFMQLPMTSPAGIPHPGVACTPFDITEGQTGQVWFLAAPLGSTCVRYATIPQGKALFFALLDAEQSSLEGNPAFPNFCPVCGNDPACQGQVATSGANLIENLACEIDTVPVPNITAYRFVNPQITFTAASPCWVFAACNGGCATTGGTGTSVGDGYYIFLNPLSVGLHTIHYKGDFAGFGSGGVLDMTYNITVQEQDDN